MLHETGSYVGFIYCVHGQRLRCPFAECIEYFKGCRSDFQASKLSDGGHKLRRLQPQRDGRVRCSAGLGDFMDELYPEMWLDEKPQAPHERRIMLGSGALWSANLQATVCASRNKSRMRATLQPARDYRLCDAVPVNARVNAAIQRENREEQAQSVALQLVAV